MGASKATWILWNDAQHSPGLNMALDEILLSHAPELPEPLVRIYEWDCKAVSIGSSQLYPADLEQQGYCIVRRPTGGGVVFHDVDLTYTVVIPPDHEITRMDRMESYRIFHEALLEELSSLGIATQLQTSEQEKVPRNTMRCFVSPSRFDLLSADGGKYAGAAQRRTRCGILHQGSILLAAAKGSRERLKQQLLESLEKKFSITFQDFALPSPWQDEAQQLAMEKYNLVAWNRDHQLPESVVAPLPPSNS